LKNLTYNCVNQITTSDHSPIFAIFEAETLKFISPSSSSSTSLQRFIIRFDSVEVTVLPEVRRRLKRKGIATRLDYSPSFHASSPPLKSVLHHQSSEKEEGKQQAVNIIGSWEAHELPGVQTPPSSLSVVQRHHLLVWVHIPNDFFLIDGSLVGTSLISLSELQTTITPTSFKLPLTLKTREVGTITGKIRLEEAL
jgi:hypothetical protein